MKTVRIGVIGAGGNTVDKHIPGLQAIPECEIVAVVNRSRESSQRVADRFGIRSVYDNWWELIDASDIDAIVIGTWPDMHSRLTVAALDAGKHVMCEARMARNTAEALDMVAAANAHPELVAQVVPSPFTLGVDATIQRLIAEGFLGDVLAVRIRDGNAFLDRDAPFGWRRDFAVSGYNVMTVGIWYEAMLRWVGEATAVTARGKTFVPQRRDGDGRIRAVRVPEHLEVTADLACGALAQIEISSVTGLAGPPEAWLFGSEGTLRLVDGVLLGGRAGDAELTEIAIPENERGGWRVEEEFVAAIRGIERITHTTFDDGLRYMEFTEAITLSMQSDETIALPLR